MEVIEKTYKNPGIDVSKIKPQKPETILENYEIDSDGVKTKVEITLKSRLPFYKLSLPEVGVATDALLCNIKDQLLDILTTSSGELLDPAVLKELKKEFTDSANILINKNLPHIDDRTRNQLTLRLKNAFFGMGNIQFLLDDHNIEEVVVNSIREPVRIYHKKYGWMKTNIQLESEHEILNQAHRIARGVGREISTLNPRLDAYLATGDRVNATLNPISMKGHTITIRKFSRDPWTAIDFINNNTIDSETYALIWLAIQHEMNILISGGTGSGKTSFLNTCMPFIPSNHRIISIEDTKELQLPDYLYWCPMITREANHEGVGEVSMLDLLVNSLRMRPDRIVMGEIRRQAEAEVLFEAMHTGHSVYSTLHANTCAQTLNRLTNSPINIPHIMLDSLHLNVVMHRDRKSGRRRVYEIGEFLENSDNASGEYRLKPNILYRWNPKEDKLQPQTEEINLYNKIGLYTGFTREEIITDLGEKRIILDWLAANNVRHVQEVGCIISNYYTDPENVLEAAVNNTNPKIFLQENKPVPVEDEGLN
jgi:flagellar protein FlaI